MVYVYDKNMLTQRDLDQVEKLTRSIVKEEIKFLPSKNEFYGKMDEVMGELKKIREEQELTTDRNSEIKDTLKDHETRIDKLEHSSNLA